jgi:hypothetical protein
MGNYTKTAEAAKECMDLGVYSLYEDYGELFRQKGMTCETIFALARSYELGEYQNIKSWVPRTAGGTANAQPSWDLLAAYECTDGLTIDKSPLFNPKNPFENRDPRCTEMFVEPGTTIYGIVYNPSPTAKTVLNTNTGAYVKNKDCKSVDQYASYNSCCLRKGSQSTWNTTLANDNPTIIIRYADVLLMYAEAKIELNQIDQSVLDAINDVRARAYKCKRSETSKYPAITTTNQDELRTVLRRERRVELAWECLRFYDLIRWRWLDKAFSHDGYGHLTAAGLTKQEAAGNFFWPAAPPIDEYGMADFSGWYEQGLIGRYTQRVYDDRLYLWPIPYEEVDISNGKIEQNPGW